MIIRIVKPNTAQGSQLAGNSRQVSTSTSGTVNTQEIVGEMHRLGQSLQVDPERKKLLKEQEYYSEQFDIKNGITANKDNICRRIEMSDGRQFVIYELESEILNENSELETWHRYERVEITPGNFKTKVKVDPESYETLGAALKAGEIKNTAAGGGYESVQIDNETGIVESHTINGNTTIYPKVLHW